MMTKQTHRFCRICLIIKPIEEFRVRGLNCIRCQKAREVTVRQRKHQPRQSLLDPRKFSRWCTECELFLDPPHFKQCRNVCEPCVKLKASVRNKTKRAIQEGIVQVLEQCELCEQELTSEIHHPDYAFPLRFLCLCIRCHRRTHENLRREREGKLPIPLEHW